MKGLKKYFTFLFIFVVGMFMFVGLVKADDTLINSFEDLQALQDTGGSAKLNADIEMTNDIRLRENIVLDLNGHELNTNITYTLIVLSESTIKDSKGTGKITNGDLTGDYVGKVDYQAIQVGSVSVSGDLTIESGNFEAKYLVHLTYGKLTINGGELKATSQYVVHTVPGKDNEVVINGGHITYSGELQAINVCDASVVMNDGVIDSTVGYGIVGWKDADITIKGGTINAHEFALSGNGSLSGANEGTNARFTISGGTLTSETASAVYAPQASGVTTITGGTFVGSNSALEIRAGSLNISGGTFTGNNGNIEIVPNGNGTTTTGAGVAVIQHTTKQPIDVVISGGKFNGYVAVAEANAQNNPQEDIEKVHITITGGEFNGKSDKAVSSDDVKNFISGGKFNTDVKEYAAAGYVTRKIGNMYHVGVLNTITITNGSNGKVTALESAIVGETVKLDVKPDAGYLLGTITIKDANDNNIELKGSEFVMPSSAVTINTTFKETKVDTEIERLDTTKEYDKLTVGVSNTNGLNTLLLESLAENAELSVKVANSEANIVLSIEESDVKAEDKAKFEEALDIDGKVNILGYYDISFKIVGPGGVVLGSIDELKEEVELTVMLPDGMPALEKGYERDYYIVREHEGKFELIKAELSEDGKSLTFKSNKFSTYAIAYNDTKPSISPKTSDGIFTYVFIGFAGVAGYLYFEQKRKAKRA